MNSMLCPDFYRPVYYNITGYYCYSDLTRLNDAARMVPSPAFHAQMVV